MKQRPLGLDIGASTIKAVLFSDKGNKLMLSVALISPTPPKGMLSEAPLDQEEMARAIRQIVEEAKITTPFVNIALPENRVYTKVLDMPVLSDRELSSAIYWEAEQYIPVPLETITLDWKVLRRPSTPNEGKMQVLLVGAPVSLVTKYQNILKLAGLTVSFAETEILSAIRALTYKSQIDKNVHFPNSLIVNVGSAITSIAIIKDGILAFTYSFAIGGAAINRAIATDLGFTITQAEEYKKVYGVSQETLGGKIGDATKPILLSIIAEIKKAIAYFKEKNPDASISQIILSGGTAKLPGIDGFFAQNCEIETATANPWNMLEGDAIPKEIQDNGPDYTIAVGLGLRNV
ncbi:MAG: type IV pilus assembly protein PilM [Candidatus Levybacteria bacterium]|nr:type IV pilus assembly protein PilM [Candidatus Levybacteria bacterium]